jgi:uncharacterized protein YbbK (DUF523 family)
MTAGGFNMKFAKPIVIVSSCLEFDKVRYNGQVMPCSIVKELEPFATFIKVCPEYEIGLGVPRDPIRVVKKDGDYRLIQHNTNRDVTDEMNLFSDTFVNGIDQVDGFIFKSKSPTMGLKDIKVYSGMKGSPVVEKCGGFFAGKVTSNYKGYPIEDENRLRNNKIRDNFLTKLFLFARFRESKSLHKFHEENKLLLEFYKNDLSGVKEDNYFENILTIMDRPPAVDQILEFFHHLIGDDPILDRYKSNRIGFETLKELAKTKIDEELLTQTFFEPYPEELRAEVENDRERDYWK